MNIQPASALPALGTLTHALVASNAQSSTLPDIFPPYHPDEMPRLYALICDGRDMEPAFKHGQTLLFARMEAWSPGDFVAVFRKPTIVPQGESHIMLKRLVSSPPPGFFMQATRKKWGKPVGTSHTKVILRQLNPDRSHILKADDVLGIHKCLGPMNEWVSS